MANSLPPEIKAAWKALPRPLEGAVSEFLPHFRRTETSRSGNEVGLTFSWSVDDSTGIDIYFQIWIYSSLELLVRTRAYIFDDVVTRAIERATGSLSRSRLPLADFLLSGAYAAIERVDLAATTESLRFDAKAESLTQHVLSSFRRFESVREHFVAQCGEGWFKGLLLYLVDSPSQEVGANIRRLGDVYVAELYGSAELVGRVRRRYSS